MPGSSLEMAETLVAACELSYVMEETALVTIQDLIESLV